MGRKQRKGAKRTTLVINLVINEGSVEVSGTTKDNISEPRQVGQESGVST